MAASIYAGFKDKLRSGLIRRLGEGTGLDGHGRPIDPVPIDIAFQGFVDDYSPFTRAQAGIPETSLRLNIFGASLGGQRPMIGDLARVDFPAANGQPARSEWYKLQERLVTDPAAALWQCEAQAVKAPA